MCRKIVCCRLFTACLELIYSVFITHGCVSTNVGKLAFTSTFGATFQTPVPISLVTYSRNTRLRDTDMKQPQQHRRFVSSFNSPHVKRRNSFLQNVQTGNEAHTASYWMSTGCSFLCGKMAEAWKWPLTSFYCSRQKCMTAYNHIVRSSICLNGLHRDKLALTLCSCCHSLEIYSFLYL
jgi:hypothetical protein